MCVFVNVLLDQTVKDNQHVLVKLPYADRFCSFRPHSYVTLNQILLFVYQSESQKDQKVKNSKSQKVCFSEFWVFSTFRTFRLFEFGSHFSTFRTFRVCARTFRLFDYSTFRVLLALFDFSDFSTFRLFEWKSSVPLFGRVTQIASTVWNTGQSLVTYHLFFIYFSFVSDVRSM